MWADVYAPKNEADLAPNKKKVTKVKEWIQEALHGCPSDAPEHFRSNRSATDKVRKYKVCLCCPMSSEIERVADDAEDTAAFWPSWCGEDYDCKSVGAGDGRGPA